MILVRLFLMVKNKDWNPLTYGGQDIFICIEMYIQYI